jgi:iron-sulfur cluster assembly protein
MKRGASVLTLTERAAATIRTLTSQPGIPADTGLRMSVQDSDAGTLALSLEGPQPGDAVIEDGGARVFVEQDAAEIVSDSELDAEFDDQGRASFMLGAQAGLGRAISGPACLDDGMNGVCLPARSPVTAVRRPRGCPSVRLAAAAA